MVLDDVVEALAPGLVHGRVQQFKHGLGVGHGEELRGVDLFLLDVLLEGGDLLGVDAEGLEEVHDVGDRGQVQLLGGEGGAEAPEKGHRGGVLVDDGDG